MSYVLAKHKFLGQPQFVTKRLFNRKITVFFDRAVNNNNNNFSCLSLRIGVNVNVKTKYHGVDNSRYWVQNYLTLILRLYYKQLEPKQSLFLWVRLHPANSATRSGSKWRRRRTTHYIHWRNWTTYIPHLSEEISFDGYLLLHWLENSQEIP